MKKTEIFRNKNNNSGLQPPTLTKRLGDELFELFANFDDDFILAVEDRDNSPPQEREELDCN